MFNSVKIKYLVRVTMSMEDYALLGGAALGGALLPSTRLGQGLGVTLKEIAAGSKLMTVDTFRGILNDAVTLSQELKYQGQIGKARSKAVSERLIAAGRVNREKGRQMWKTGRDLKKGAKSLARAYGRVGEETLKKKALQNIDIGKQLYKEGIELEAAGMAMKGQGRLRSLKQKAISVGQQGKIAVKGVGRMATGATRKVGAGAIRILKSPVTARKIVTRGRGWGVKRLTKKYKKIKSKIPKDTLQKSLVYGAGGSLFTVGAPLLVNKIIKIIEKKEEKKRRARKNFTTPTATTKKMKGILTRTSDELPVFGSKLSRKLRRRIRRS